jgi:hypothetical protein
MKQMKRVSLYYLSKMPRRARRRESSEGEESEDEQGAMLVDEPVDLTLEAVIACNLVF